MSNHKNKIYRVLPSPMAGKKNGNIMLYWLDVTNLENLKTLYNEEKICYAYVNIDNYDELISAASDERKGMLTANRKHHPSMGSQNVRNHCATKLEKYFIVFEQKYLEKIESSKFVILDEVRAVETEGDFPPSFPSVSVGRQDPGGTGRMPWRP